MGQQGLEQVGHALAMFGGKGDGFAKAKAKGFHDAAFRRFPFGLVGDQHDRRIAFAKPAGNFLVQRRDACARVDQEQGDIAIFDRRLRLETHPARQRLRVFVLITGGVDDGEVQPQKMRLALPPVARDARLVIHQRQLLADQAVEQGGLAYIGPSHDRYGGQHGPFPSSQKTDAPARAGGWPIGWTPPPACAGARLA